MPSDAENPTLTVVEWSCCLPLIRIGAQSLPESDPIHFSSPQVLKLSPKRDGYSIDQRALESQMRKAFMSRGPQKYYLLERPTKDNRDAIPPAPAAADASGPTNGGQPQENPTNAGPPPGGEQPSPPTNQQPSPPTNTLPPHPVYGRAETSKAALADGMDLEVEVAPQVEVAVAPRGGEIPPPLEVAGATATGPVGAKTQRSSVSVATGGGAGRRRSSQYSKDLQDLEKKVRARLCLEWS
jgi:hypothetical protein